jgi:hypothetical protein
MFFPREARMARMARKTAVAAKPGKSLPVFSSRVKNHMNIPGDPSLIAPTTEIPIVAIQAKTPAVAEKRAQFLAACALG